MGCGGNNQSTRQAQLPKKLTIYVNVLDNNMRIPIMACKIGDKEYIYKPIDFLNPKQKNIEFAQVNPTGYIQLIEEG